YDYPNTYTSTQNGFVYNFSTPGWFLVTFQIDNCPVQYDTVMVNQNCGNCQAYFDWYIDSITGETWIVDMSSGNPLQVFWDFGDGNTTTSNNTSHQYVNGGWYVVCLTIGTPNTPNCFDTYCDSIYVTSGQLRSTQASGVEETLTLNNMTIFPNPVSDFVNVQLDMHTSTDVQIRILTMGGQQVAGQVKNLSAGTQVVQLPVYELSNGIYIIEVTDMHSQQSVREKLIK